MAFATAEDVATRLARTLSDAETASAELLVDLASEVIAAACDTSVDALSAEDTPVLRVVCVELACRALANPENVAGKSEALGAYNYSKTFRGVADASTALALTETETNLVRRAVFKLLSGSSRPESTSDELYDYVYGS